DGKIENEGKLYSIICQGPNQPIIYSQDEIKDIAAYRRKRLVKYWNFTYEEPVYYECPNSQYPHLNFMSGYHPAGYCLPCCKKRPMTDGDEIDNCMSRIMQHDQKKKISTEKTTTKQQQRADRNRSYVFEYSVDPLDEGRMGTVPYFEKIIPIDKGDDSSDPI